MNVFNRLKNGWQLGITSFKVIRENSNLLIFPILSTTALMLVSLTFMVR